MPIDDDRQSRCIGLVGGLGPESTITYYKRLVALFRENERALHLKISHADIGHVGRLVMSGDNRALADHLASHFESLAGAGADILGISAVAPHVCVDELAARTPLPVVNILEEIQANAEVREADRVVIFGAASTMRTRLFGALPAEKVAMLGEENFDFVASAYMRIASTGEATPGDIDRLREIAADAVKSRGAKALLIAGTDLSHLFEHGISCPVIDVTSIHVESFYLKAISD